MQISIFGKLVGAAGLLICLLTAARPATAQNWMAQIGGLGPEVVFDLVETRDGHLCATGTFTDAAEFGAGKKQVTLQAEATQDVYVACFTEEGELLTAVQFGGDISDQPRAMAALPDGDILIAGYFLNALGPHKSKSLQASGGADIFLIRMSADGQEVWSRQFGGSFADKANSLAVTHDGDILLAGNFQETISYQSGGTTRSISSAGGRDAFVFKLDSAGNIKWAESFGGKGRDEASRVVAGPDGSIYLAGTFEDAAQLGQSGGSLTAAHGADGFLLALSGSGELRWTRQLAGSNREYVSGLVIDDAGALYLSGNFLDTMTLPDKSLVQSNGSSDVFLLKFDQEGKQLWQRHVGGTGIDESFDLAITTKQGLLLSGHFQGDVDIQTDEQPARMSSHDKGNPDGFILAFDKDGNYQQAMTATGEGVETLFAVAALHGGGIATAGFFNKELTMHVDGLGKLERRGQTDVFVVRVAGGSFSTAADLAIHITLSAGPYSMR